jgi:hypothetical protein
MLLLETDGGSILLVEGFCHQEVPKFFSGITHVHLQTICFICE